MIAGREHLSALEFSDSKASNWLIEQKTFSLANRICINSLAYDRQQWMVALPTD